MKSRNRHGAHGRAGKSSRQDRDRHDHSRTADLDPDLSPEDAMDLQGTLGNEAISRMIRERGGGMDGEPTARGGGGRAAQGGPAFEGADGGDLSQVATLGKTAALAAQRRVQETLYQTIDAGLAAGPTSERDGAAKPADFDNVFHNACDWVDAGLAQAVALAPVANAWLYTDAQGYVPHFDLTRHFPDKGGEYPDQIDASSDQLVWLPQGRFNGVALDGNTLGFATTDGDQIRKTLIHEVQHDADRHESTFRTKGSGSIATAKDFYKTEFRANWVSDGVEEEAEDPATNATQISSGSDGVGTNFKNARQEAIFLRLHAATDIYPDLALEKNYVENEGFRKFVNNYNRPVGANLIDSPRIELLIQQIEQCNREMSADDPAVEQVRSLTAQLEPLDCQYLKKKKKKNKQFWNLARTRLPEDVRKGMKATIKEGA